jgi:hypothetical protein
MLLARSPFGLLKKNRGWCGAIFLARSDTAPPFLLLRLNWRYAADRERDGHRTH